MTSPDDDDEYLQARQCSNIYAEESAIYDTVQDRTDAEKGRVGTNEYLPDLTTDRAGGNIYEGGFTVFHTANGRTGGVPQRPDGDQCGDTVDILPIQRSRHSDTNPQGHENTKVLSRLPLLYIWLAILTVIVIASLALELYIVIFQMANQPKGVNTTNGSFHQGSPFSTGNDSNVIPQTDLKTSQDHSLYLEAGKVNIALGKPAFQSSEYRGGGEGPSSVVDGSFRADKSGSCSRTREGQEMSPWWKVDLGAIFQISSITVTGRGNVIKDCRNNNLEIRVGSHENHTDNPLCYYFHGNLGRSITRIFRCNSELSGRWVSVQRVVKIPGGSLGVPFPGSSYTGGCQEREPLELCEVQIYSIYG